MATMKIKAEQMPITMYAPFLKNVLCKIRVTISSITFYNWKFKYQTHSWLLVSAVKDSPKSGLIKLINETV